MVKVNITAKARAAAEHAGLYIETGIQRRYLKDGSVRETHIIDVGEEDSDFLVRYGISQDGSLFLALSPSYVEDLPAHILTSTQFRRVAEHLAMVPVD